MSRLSSHLPSLAGLAVAVVAAAVAYSVYDGQSARPESASSTQGAGPAAADPGSTTAAAEPRQSRDSGRARPTADGGFRAATIATIDSGTDAALSAVPAGGTPDLGQPLVEPVATKPPVSPPSSRPKPDGGTPLDRELQRLIDGPGAPKSKPRSPKSPAPPNVSPPGGEAPSGPPPVQATGPGATPTDPAATPADPDAALDDTPVGGLDQTDLGEPVDEVDTGTTPTDPAAAPADPGVTPADPAAAPADPGAAPADPEAGLDDTAGGGLDQTDLGGPVG